MARRIHNYYRRQIVRRVGRLFQTLLTRTTVTGREFIPPRGPYIAIGNHIAAIEVALLVLNLPHPPELVGNGDVPFDPTFSFMARWYGFIPIRRGHIDRGALDQARRVLEDGNVLGIFPEGGIWDHAARAARPGVAWLSQQTGVPILPIGFGGVRGAFNKIMHLKRPRLSMSIGPLMPPVPNLPSNRARKAAIEDASEEMMRRIQMLVPPDDEVGRAPVVEEQYAFSLDITTPDGLAAALPGEMSIPHGEDLAFYFHRYVLLEVIYRNFKRMAAKPLAEYTYRTDPKELGAALDVALDFYEHDPVFLGYRLGYPRAERIMEGLHALRAALQWAAAAGCQVHIIPQRTIIRADGTTEISIEPSVKREY